MAKYLQYVKDKKNLQVGIYGNIKMLNRIVTVPYTSYIFEPFSSIEPDLPI